MNHELEAREKLDTTVGSEIVRKFRKQHLPMVAGYFVLFLIVVALLALGSQMLLDLSLDDLGGDVEGDALDGVNAAVIDVDVLYFQNRSHAQASFCLPR